MGYVLVDDRCVGIGMESAAYFTDRVAQLWRPLQHPLAIGCSRFKWLGFLRDSRVGCSRDWRAIHSEKRLPAGPGILLEWGVGSSGSDGRCISIGFHRLVVCGPDRAAENTGLCLNFSLRSLDAAPARLG